VPPEQGCRWGDRTRWTKELRPKPRRKLGRRMRPGLERERDVLRWFEGSGEKPWKMGVEEGWDASVAGGLVVVWVGR
jgi:hypothetical protein